MISHLVGTSIALLQDHAGPNNPIENVNLPYCSELEFIANETKHKFGPTIISLLKKCNCVRKLSIQMFRREVYILLLLPPIQGRIDA
jgi:hypothetical protein